MGYSTLEKLNNEFLQEAKSAPKLFKDLAKVEQYIAESYRTRAFIELIQNADDAGSTKFGIHTLKDGFAVGNNGRPFTLADVESLCRSGSSNKHRGGSTIGYRGIGFKSVVNLASQIYVFSGDFKFFFNKTRTQEILESTLDVPLIRIPHQLKDQDSHLQKEASNLSDKNGYTTIFIFQCLINEIPLEELAEFNRSSLIFLKSLKSLKIDYQEISRNISLQILNEKERKIIKIEESNSFDIWEVDALSDNTITQVALKRECDNIVPATEKESVIHSFTPTSEFAGAYLKINGDFSTDPSRKNIDMDEMSKIALADAVQIISNSILEIVQGDSLRRGFFSPFLHTDHQESSRFKSLLLKQLRESLRTAHLQYQGQYFNFYDLRIKPHWLNYEDYEVLCVNKLIPIPKSLVAIHPDIFDFLDSVSVSKLCLEEILARVNLARLSPVGYAQVLVKLINQNIYDLSKDKIKEIKTLRIIPVEGDTLTFGSVFSAEEISIECKNYLESHLEQDDIANFFRKLGIRWILAKNHITDPEKSPGDKRKENEKTHENIFSAASKSGRSVENFGLEAKPAIKKWRSAEKNAAEYLKAFRSVLSVEDVTQANLGYDLEVTLVTGNKIFIEVKSVATYSEAFKITNNEYSSAHSYGENYFIALVINDEPFSMRLIANPIKILKFEKKCERWSWHCSEYLDFLRNVQEELF